jgi:NAD(P)-dependent dehydrogenase (short-subunit alcohol dehydrogenase family)
VPPVFLDTAEAEHHATFRAGRSRWGPVSWVPRAPEGSRRPNVRVVPADELAGLDVLVHAVGTNDRRPVVDVADEVWERIVTLNLSNAFYAGRAAGRLMHEAGGAARAVSTNW